MPVDPPAQREIARALGQQLAERRRDLELTQDTLAERVDLSRVQLQNIEHGLSDRAKGTPGNPQLSTLIALCRELRGRVIIDVSRPAGLTVEFDPETPAATTRPTP